MGLFDFFKRNKKQRQLRDITVLTVNIDGYTFSKTDINRLVTAFSSAGITRLRIFFLRITLLQFVILLHGVLARKDDEWLILASRTGCIESVAYLIPKWAVLKMSF